MRQLLKQLKLRDVAEGKAVLGGKHKKDAGTIEYAMPCIEFARNRSELNGFSSGRRNLSLTMVRRVHTVHMNSQSAHTWPGDSAPEEDGYMSHLSLEKRSGKTCTHYQRISSGVFST